MTPIHRPLAHLAAWLLALAFCAAGATQDPAGKPAETPAAQPAENQPAKKLSDWPALAPADRNRLPALVGQLKKDNPELQQGGREALIAIGDAAAPFLFQQANDKDEALNTQLFAVFDKILDGRHAALMARESKKNKLELRKYLVMRLSRFVDPELKPVLVAAAKDKDEEVVFHAQLGLAGLKDLPALSFLLEHTRKGWDARRALVVAVLPAARCDECARALADEIAKAQPPVQAAGLRLLRYVCPKGQDGIVRSYLMAEDHGVKKEAVNAMRAIHGEDPIENLDAFRAIEMAKEWLAK